jgi:S-DNA-T family DNA segregation ATPase FtsK/SpoIIIE
MTAELSLIGRMAARLIRNKLDLGLREHGVAKFLVHGLAKEEVLAIVSAITREPGLAERLEIKLPRHTFADAPEVTADILTDIPATELRHAHCDREGRLMVLMDSRQQQSVAQITPIDADALLDTEAVGGWIEEAEDGLSLPGELKEQWQAALTGLLKIDRVGLRQIATWLAAIRAELGAGSALPRAVGRALPAIGLPRHDGLFGDIPPAKLAWQSQWRPRFEAHWRRQNYMAKRDQQQIPFARGRLREKLQELHEELREEVREALEAYIAAPDGASPAATALFAHDWSELNQFFEEAQKAGGRSIGEETFAFYKIRPEMLTAPELAYLEDFRDNRRQAQPAKQLQDEEFYAAHADELRDEPRLAALWERFIFGQKVECDDLIDGLLQCLQRTYQAGETQPRKLVVEAHEDRPTRFLHMNAEVCRYFATRYRGAREAFKGVIEFRRANAFDYFTFEKDIEDSARRTPASMSRRSRQLNFRVWLENEDPAAPGRTGEVKLVWECDPKAVGLSLSRDLDRLNNNNASTPLVECLSGQVRANARGRAAGVDLANVSSLEPVGGRDRGAFVPARSKCRSIPKLWRAQLTGLVERQLVGAEAAALLTKAFEHFAQVYTASLADLGVLGYGAPSLQAQAEAYGQLLDRILAEVSAPMALHPLLRPLLSIGVAPWSDTATGQPAAIVCPWHPLRLASQAARWRVWRDRLTKLLGAEPTTFTDTGALFFSDLRRAMAVDGRPEVVVGWLAEQPTLLSWVDGRNDYTLHETPVVQPGATRATGDRVGGVARQIGELVKAYLKLQPHEKDNLSVVLFNSDAAALPQAVVDVVRADAEREDGEAMCQVKLRHKDDAKLRDLYRQLVGREVGDGLHASEATSDFMARLRISILVHTAAPNLSGEDPPEDIVFCHDVISRAATLGWIELEHITRAPQDIDAGHWSRRRPIQRGDRDAAVYLACPAQPPEGWSYLDAVAALHDEVQAARARANGATLMPARRTNLLDPATQSVLEETHRLGSWVVNFDDLLDRRQLADNQIRIIRYKHAATGGRNLIISSKAPDTLLRATLQTRIRALDPSYDSAALQDLSSRLIDDANEISGDIVLRAAKRGSNASELIGVVLSRFLVDAELGHTAAKAWIFLDDYAAWLGQNEKQIADLLCLAPGVDKDGRPVLDLVVTEAKYVGAASASSKAVESARQLHDTLKRLERALLGEEAPADQSIWLARLSDMLLDGLRDPAGAFGEGANWRTALRDGACRFRVRGYSHVFAHSSPTAATTAPDRLVGVKGTDTGQQEQFSPESLRKLLRAYADRRDPGPVRAEVRGEPTPTGSATPAPPVRSTNESAPGLDTQPVPAEVATAASPQTSAGQSAAAPPVLNGRAVGGPHLAALLQVSGHAGTGLAEDDAWLQDVANRCRSALMRYGMTARLEQSVLTPNAGLLKFKGSDDLTVAAVERKLEELETTHSLQVLSVRAEPGRVVIYIRRPVRQVLSLGDVWRGWEVDPSQPNTKLLIALREEDGEPLFLEPEPAPHTLVAGSTGSGKSVLIQNILLAIAATNRPDQAQIHLIDPKAGVDYFAFEGLPHLNGGVVDTPEAALVVLEALVAEMEKRYSLFRQARASNLKSYNAKSSERLPLIWLVHDEFADWMQIDSYRAGVESVVTRLGVKARAAGIYLIFAAQRPDATVFPMQLRSNLGNRLVLRVDSAGTSDLSLGVKGAGAERLLGKGHLAALLGGGAAPILAQVPFIDEDELARLVDAVIADQADQTP